MELQQAKALVGKFKSVDLLFSEDLSSNLIYDPVKYYIGPISNLASCMVNIGSWAVAIRTTTEEISNWNEDMTVYKHAYEKIFIHSINTYCQSAFLTEAPNKIGRGVILSEDAALAFIKRKNIESDFGSIIDMANEIFVNKEYQIETELLVDPESEEWETLLFRFYVKLTGDEFLPYQKKLTKGFVSAIEPSKRIYFSLSIEPI